MDKRLIVHIIQCDKFTENYIDYMSKKFSEYNHFFAVVGNSNKEIQSRFDFERIDTSYGLMRRDIIKKLKKSEKIIVSGVFGKVDRYCPFIVYRDLLDKTLFHFWGGDFYSFRDKNHWYQLNTKICKYVKLYCFKKAEGLIFLIDGEYAQFSKITGVHNEKVYVAGMPEKPINQKSITHLENRAGDASADLTRGIRILLGNSAEPTNQHLQIISLLGKHYSKDEYIVICPLSYPQNDYQKEVISEGEKILGKKFEPLKNFMSLDEYRSLLKSIDVAIFNNNRQQAMGNINALLGMGKKVFIRTDTSMWESYQKRGYIVYPTEMIEQMNMQEFLFISEENRLNNINKYLNEISVDLVFNQWDSILNR